MTVQALQKQATEGIMTLTMDQLQVIVRAINNMKNEDRDYVGEAIARGDGPFKKLTEEDVMKDLTISHKQYENGESEEIHSAISRMRREHGFI